MLLKLVEATAGLSPGVLRPAESAVVAAAEKCTGG